MPQRELQFIPPAREFYRATARLDAREAMGRLLAVLCYRALRARGFTNSSVAHRIGVPFVTLWRWDRKVKESGWAGVLPVKALRKTKKAGE